MIVGPIRIDSGVRTEAALGVVAVVEVVPLRALKDEVEGADGKPVAGMHIDGLPHADHEPEPQDERVGAEEDACVDFGMIERGRVSPGTMALSNVYGTHGTLT